MASSSENNLTTTPSTEKLTDYLNHKIYHSTPEILPTQILPWEACSLVIGYAKEIYHDRHGRSCADVKALMQTIRDLETKAKEFAHENLDSLSAESAEKERELHDILVKSLIPQAHIYFKLPISDITPVAIMFAFLFCILENPEPNHHVEIKNQLVFPYIIKELKFLFFITGDIKLHSIGEGYLMEEFRSMADEAGEFIYHCVLAVRLVDDAWFDEHLPILNSNLQLLNAKIINHCNHFAHFSKPYDIDASPFSSTDILNSLVEIESLQALLEDLMNRHLDTIDDKMRSHMQKLHENLRSKRSFLKAVIANLLQQQGEHDTALKKCVIPIRTVIAEAQFLIKSFLADHFPGWYMSHRLDHVITKLEIIETSKTVINRQAMKYQRTLRLKLHRVISKLEIIGKAFKKVLHLKENENDTPVTLPLISITHLSKYLTGRDFSGTLPWNSLSCLAIICYGLKLSSDDNSLMNAIRDLNHLASEYKADHSQKERKISEVLKDTLMPMTQKLFTLTRSSNIPGPNIEKLAAFIHLLLQLLNSESDSIGNDKGYISFHEGLTLLLAALGDMPFQQVEIEEVGNILKEFETVVNEAGKFIFSYISTTHPTNVNWFSDSMDILIPNFYPLTKKIKKHIKFSISATASINPPNIVGAIDSLFIVESLLEDLENFMNCDLDLKGADVKAQIEEVQKKLEEIQSVLLCHNREREEIKETVVQIRDAAYEAEYLINSFVSGNFPCWYMTLRLPIVISKLDMFLERLQKVNKVDDIQASEAPDDYNANESQERAIDTSSVMNDTTFVGHENEAKHIVDKLIRGSKNLQTIMVVGMAGIGKTTLTKKIYNDGNIRNYFDRRAWCVVSQTYQKRKVLTDILISLRMLDIDKLLKMEDDNLATAIYQCLFGRRYLIVIDDVWNTDIWDDLQRYFCNGVNGSRILFTSRNQSAAPTGSTIYKLPMMTEDQCWKLLEKKLFGEKKCPNQLVESGKQITRKCSGSPLLVVIIAGILANMEKEESVWEKVGKKLDSHTSDSYIGECMKVLELSYTHLPDPLKLCFLYLGVFPEDTEIPVQKLIWIWIAEGFITKQAGRKPEHVAQEYLNPLIDRSLVSIAKRKSSGGVKACSVHDLLRDMCLTKAREEKFLTLITPYDASAFEKHQRLCVHSTGVAYVRPLSLHCRSFFGHLSDPSSCFPQMKQVRVIELSRNIEEVSLFYRLRKLDLLVHLRYLIVDRLPEGILSNLVNLEFLRIDSLSEEVWLPSCVLELEKLRHVHVRMQAKFEKDCDISHKNKLDTLSFFNIYHAKAYEILKCSPHLCKLKCMCMLLIPDFRFLTELESLTIGVERLFQITVNYTEIKLPSTIRKLTLHGSSLPWKMMSVLEKLPNLQVLKLLRDAFVGEEWEISNDVDDEFKIEFTELKFLKFQELQLKDWSASSENFPSLEHLVFNRCEKLQNIPIEFGTSPTLQMIEVHFCSEEASSSALEIDQTQRENGNETLEVIITNDR